LAGRLGWRWRPGGRGNCRACAWRTRDRYGYGYYGPYGYAPGYYYPPRYYYPRYYYGYAPRYYRYGYAPRYRYGYVRRYYRPWRYY
jgi:hypothetical protein